ncbi:MAG: hypothetical protein V4557_19465 [Bacteroidota bacterium]
MQQDKKQIFRMLTVVALFFIACGAPDCKNENRVFEKYPVDSKEYINELARILKANDETGISFWFDRYEKQQGKEYLFVDIIGKKFCAKGKILVTDWNKIEGIQRTKGISYSGAGLVGFKVDYIQDSTSTVLVYKNIDYIFD